VSCDSGFYFCLVIWLLFLPCDMATSWLLTLLFSDLRQEIFSVAGCAVGTLGSALQQSDALSYTPSVTAEQMPVFMSDAAAGEENAIQALVTALRTWPAIFRSDLIDVAMPDPGIVTGGEDVSANQTAAMNTTAVAGGRSRWFALVPPPTPPRETAAMQACLVELSRRPTAALVIVHCIGSGGLDLAIEAISELMSSLDTHLRLSFPCGLGGQVNVESEGLNSSLASTVVPAHLWTVIEPGHGRSRRLLEWLCSEAFVFDKPRLAHLSFADAKRHVHSRSGSSVAPLPSTSLWPLFSLALPRRVTKEWDGFLGPLPTPKRALNRTWELNPGGRAACKVVFGQLVRNRYRIGFRAGHMVRRDPGHLMISLVCSVPVIKCGENVLSKASVPFKCADGWAEKDFTAVTKENGQQTSESLSTAMIQCRVELDCRDEDRMGSVRVAVFMEPISDGFIICSQLPPALHTGIFLDEGSPNSNMKMSAEGFFAAAVSALRNCDQQFGECVAAYEELYLHCEKGRNQGSQGMSSLNICCIERLTRNIQPLVLNFRQLPLEPPIDSASERHTANTSEENKTVEESSQLPAPALANWSNTDTAASERALREEFVQTAGQGFGSEWRPFSKGIFNQWRCFLRLHSDSILLLLLPPPFYSLHDERTKSSGLGPCGDELWEWHYGENECTGLQDSRTVSGEAYDTKRENDGPSASSFQVILNSIVARILKSVSRLKT
jgi:hypothetical protein